MSVHIFPASANGRDLEVRIGYDRPLNGFHMVVCDPADDDELPVYCNLDDPDLAHCGGLPDDLQHFTMRLGELGLHLPESIAQQVLSDGAVRMGNRVCVYDANGVATTKAGA